MLACCVRIHRGIIQPFFGPHMGSSWLLGCLYSLATKLCAVQSPAGRVLRTFPESENRPNVKYKSYNLHILRFVCLLFKFPSRNCFVVHICHLHFLRYSTHYHMRFCNKSSAIMDVNTNSQVPMQLCTAVPTSEKS